MVSRNRFQICIIGIRVFRIRDFLCFFLYFVGVQVIVFLEAEDEEILLAWDIKEKERRTMNLKNDTIDGM